MGLQGLTRRGTQSTHQCGPVCVQEMLAFTSELSAGGDHMKRTQCLCFLILTNASLYSTVTLRKVLKHPRCPKGVGTLCSSPPSAPVHLVGVQRPSPLVGSPPSRTGHWQWPLWWPPWAKTPFSSPLGKNVFFVLLILGWTDPGRDSELPGDGQRFSLQGCDGLFYCTVSL